MRVETIQLKPTVELSQLCHECKNLYNLGNYYINMNYEILEEYLNWYDTKWMLKTSQPFKNIPSQVAQNVLKYLHLAWKSYFSALKDYKRNPKKYKRRPQTPKYLNKNGEYFACFNHQHIKIKNKKLYFPKKTNLPSIEVITEQKDLQQVRIVPKNDIYNLELIYNHIEKYDLNLNKKRILAIDLGINNLACCVNNIELQPFTINGRPLKSINHYFNKKMAENRSSYNKQGFLYGDTKRAKKLRRIRNNKIKDYMHKASRHIINYCLEHKIGMIVIGKNDGWKQEVKMGKKGNQRFIQIPFEFLLQKLQYKGEQCGIEIKFTTEEYTSQTCCKCGIIKKSNRKYRGLYICSNCSIEINADVNGAYNIMKKAFPNSIMPEGIKGTQLYPLLINLDTKSRIGGIKHS